MVVARTLNVGHFTLSKGGFKLDSYASFHFYRSS